MFNFRITCVLLLTGSALFGCARADEGTPTGNGDSALSAPVLPDIPNVAVDNPCPEAKAPAVAAPAVSAGATATAGGGGTITIGTTDTITSLDPANAYEYLSVNILENTLGTLLVNKPDSAELVPELAAAPPSVSPEGCFYTFFLRSGIKYADGTAIKASDFLWALERNSGKIGRQEGAPAFLIYDSPGVDVANSTADDSTGRVTIKLKQPGVFFNSLGVLPNFAPLPREKYTKAAFVEPTGTTTSLPLSSGPYRVTEYRRRETVRLEPNPYYAGPRTARADAIVIKQYSTSASMKSALLNGEIDVALHTFTPDEWKDLTGRSGTDVKTMDAPGPTPLRFLCANVSIAGSGMDKREVRQALALIVDRTQIDEVVFGGSVNPAYSIVATGLPGYTDSYKRMYGAAPDLSRAAALMESAGYTRSNPLAIDLWFNSDGHYGDTEADLATVLKSQLEASGYFRIRLQSKPWAEFRKDATAGNFAMFLIGWFPDYLDADDYISPFLTPGGAASYGTYYTNDALQPLIKAEQAETDTNRRAELLGAIQDTAAADNPMLPLFSGSQQVAYRANVSGITLSPTNIFPYYTLSKR